MGVLIWSLRVWPHVSLDGILKEMYRCFECFGTRPPLNQMPQKAALQTRLGRARVALTRLRQEFAAGRPVRAQLLEARAALFVTDVTPLS